jgi:hypothetical protein
MPNLPAIEIERAQHLTALTERLSEIITDEIALLQKRRPREIAAFAEEKTRLAKIYSGEIARLRKEPRLARDLPREVAQALKQATARFRELTARQESLLLAMRTVSERMIREVAGELHRMRAPETNYGRNAAYAGRSATPFALNKTA